MNIVILTLPHPTFFVMRGGEHSDEKELCRTRVLKKVREGGLRVEEGAKVSSGMYKAFQQYIPTCSSWHSGVRLGGKICSVSGIIAHLSLSTNF